MRTGEGVGRALGAGAEEGAGAGRRWGEDDARGVGGFGGGFGGGVGCGGVGAAGGGAGGGAAAVVRLFAGDLHFETGSLGAGGVAGQGGDRLAAVGNGTYAGWARGWRLLGGAALDVADIDGLGALVVFFGFDVGGGCGADAPGLGE